MERLMQKIQNKSAHVAVIGMGYMGLPMALLLNRAGYRVTGVDVNTEKIKLLSAKVLPFEEAGLQELFDEVKNNDNLVFSNDYVAADAYIISVPTPFNEVLRRAGLDYVKSAAESIAKVVQGGALVILESTVSPNTLKNLVIPIFEKKGFKSEESMFFAHCPERAIPGKTLFELVHNDRIAGGNGPKATALAKALYSSFVEGNIFETNDSTAEMVKIMENTYRDINIALANELAKICNEKGINVHEAISLANKHPRVHIHNPGPGVGGHCIAIDPWFVIEDTRYGSLIQTARNINDNMPNYVVSEVFNLVKDIEKPQIAVLGVAYKGNVDDCRETPALKVIHDIKEMGWGYKIHDPYVKKFSEPVSINLSEVCAGADCILVLTDHDEYKNIDFGVLAGIVRNKIIYDTRNVIDRNLAAANSFTSFVLGGGNVQ